MESKLIPGFSNYRVTSDGVVTNIRGMRLSDYNSNGYRCIGITRDDGRREGIGIHRLVAMTWIGPIPKGCWVNHEDGNKSNNDVSNLRIDTPSYNHQHAFRTLRRKAGNVDVLMSRALLALHQSGFSNYDIARLLGCSQPNVSQRLKTAKLLANQ